MGKARGGKPLNRTQSMTGLYGSPACSGGRKGALILQLSLATNHPQNINCPNRSQQELHCLFSAMRLILHYIANFQICKSFLP